MKCWFTNREKGTTHDHLREPHENKNYILIILISPLVDNPLTAPIRREYTTQKIRTSSANKAKHIIIEKRPTSDGTTTHITELSFCFPSSAKSTSGTQLLIVDIFFLLSSLIQFSLPSWIYALVFSIILVGRETGVFSDNNIRGFFFRFFFLIPMVSVFFQYSKYHSPPPPLYFCLLILTSLFLWRLSSNV